MRANQQVNPATPQDPSVEVSGASGVLPELGSSGESAREILQHTPATLPGRPLIYGHIVNYKDTAQASLNGAVAILEGRMRLSGNGAIWMWVVSGDINNMGPPEEVPEQDNFRLDRFSGQFYPGKVGFFVYGGEELSNAVQEQGNIGLCRIQNVFTAYDSPYKFAVLFRGEREDAAFSLLERHVDRHNQERAQVGLAPIILAAWTEGRDLRELRALLEADPF